jgi:hypothetical protein
MTDPIRVLTNHNWLENGTEIQIRQGDKIIMPALVDRPRAGEPQPISIGAEHGEQFLRACLNAAWEIGLRPDGYNDTRESMKATDAHLQDMRALVFGKFGVEKPR